MDDFFSREDAGASQAQYRTLVEAIPDILYVFSDKRGTLFLNSRVEGILGYPPSELIAEPFLWNELVHPEDRDEVERVTAEHRKDLSQYEVQYRMRHRKGHWVSLSDRSHNLVRQGSEVVVTGLATDITENRRLSDRLLQSQKLESLGILAGGIAHDFNNLLAGLSGNLELARFHLKAGDTDLALTRIDKTRGTFDRARALTHQLLTFSKGGSPVRELQNLGRKIREWVDFALVGSDSIPQIEIADDLQTCECDSQQIGQAIDNFLINARQVSPPGGTITVRATNVTRERPMIRISVADQGAGIPPDILDKIFDPFFTTKATGTGLGLPMAFSIAQRHRGWIEVETEVGRGSTFSLFLPAATGTAPKVATLGAVEFRGRGPAVILDDDESLRDAIGAMLETLGYTVTRLKDGLDVVALALEAERSGHPLALALLDLTIPGGHGGLEAARRMKEAGLNVPVVIMSGYWEEFSAEEQAALNLKGRLSKPFTLQDLGRLLARMPTS